MELNGIRIDGYYNTWSEIDRVEDYRLMENDVYGDETFYLVIDASLKVITQTYDDINTALHDCEISISNPTELEITQEDGIISVYKDNELQYSINMNRKNKMSEIALANMIAELIHDCINCKTATAKLKDLNDTHSYYDTYFARIDFL